MKYDEHLVSAAWSDYELLDSGTGMKLERFGAVTLGRPETQAIWEKKKPEIWENAHAIFAFTDGRGNWEMKKSVPESWQLEWNDAHFTARLTNFKHTGIFPEQAPNWEWLVTRMKDLVGLSHEMPRVLNLFGYTGIASIVAAQAGLRHAEAGSGLAEAGAHVTHVDASKQSLDWAHDNAKLSNVSETSIRWMLDDALAFVKREVRREAKYDGIILDPPAFGRGAKGEVWKIEEDLLPLLQELKKLLSERPGAFFLLNGYAAGYASRSFAQAVESIFGETQGEAGELHIRESTSDRVVPSGIYVRFVR